MFSRRPATLSVALVLALGLSAGLAGCGSFNPVESAIEGATGTDVELPGTEVPEGFPSEVPLTDGDVVFGGAFGSADTGKAFQVTIRVDGLETLDTITDEMDAAGFTPVEGTTTTTDGSATSVFDDGTWNVVVIISDDGSGFIANYTVTQAAAQ